MASYSCQFHFAEDVTESSVAEVAEPNHTVSKWPEFESNRPDIKSQALTHSSWPLFNNSSKIYSLTVKLTPLNFIDILKVIHRLL